MFLVVIWAKYLCLGILYYQKRNFPPDKTIFTAKIITNMSTCVCKDVTKQQTNKEFFLVPHAIFVIKCNAKFARKSLKSRYLPNQELYISTASAIGSQSLRRSRLCSSCNPKSNQIKNLCYETKELKLLLPRKSRGPSHTHKNR